ncbi:unnamed protein product [Arctogadus glacialis]
MHGDGKATGSCKTAASAVHQHRASTVGDATPINKLPQRYDRPKAPYANICPHPHNLQKQWRVVISSLLVESCPPRDLNLQSGKSGRLLEDKKKPGSFFL